MYIVKTFFFMSKNINNTMYFFKICSLKYQRINNDIHITLKASKHVKKNVQNKLPKKGEGKFILQQKL